MLKRMLENAVRMVVVLKRLLSTDDVAEDDYAGMLKKMIKRVL